MASDKAEPLEIFDSWFLHRVAQAVEAGEVPVNFLTELQAEIDVARENPEEERRAAAIQHIADLTSIEEALKGSSPLFALGRNRGP